MPMTGGVYALVVAITVCSGVFGADSAGSVITKLHFFIHDTVNLQDPANATTALVAAPNNNLTTMQPLGSVMVVDDKITAGPSPDSAEIGRARGFYMSDSAPGTPVADTGIFFAVTVVLANGSISLHGQDNVLQPVRELAVIGGTGVFRSAYGYALISTIKFIPPLSVVLDVQVFLKMRRF